MLTRLLLVMVCISVYVASFSQSVQEQMTRQQPDCQDVLINASEVLPKLYTIHSFDSMKVALGLMQRFCGESADEVFYLITLLHIQQSTFSFIEISEAYRFNRLLYGYYIDTSTRRFNMGYHRYYSLYNTWQNNLPPLVQTWAKDLLNKPGLTANELFVCNVLAGNFRNPETTLKQEKDKYPELYALLQSRYTKDREEGGGVFNLMAGVWIPNKNLKILGTHPSLGLQAGGRGKRNEVLVTLQLRFLMAANLYTVRRSDSLYRLNHFFGGYIGLDYFHYFLHSTRFEAGVVAGAGYDGFDISSSSDDDKDYLKPLSIGSLNVNAGLRFNYFLFPEYLSG